MKKTHFFISFIVVIAIFSGCSSDEKKDTNQTKLTSNLATASSIEVSQNENINEIKVAPKSKDDENRAYYGNYNQDVAPIENKKPRTTIDANINVRSPYEKVQLSMLVKGLSKDFILKCSACHNDYANGVIGPSLLGKSSEYIKEKIDKFKGDRTINVLMSDLVSGMSDKEIKDIADEIFNFNEEIKKMRNKQ